MPKKIAELFTIDEDHQKVGSMMNYFLFHNECSYETEVYNIIWCPYNVL